MCLLLVAAYQPAGLQVSEAKALYLTAEPAAEALSLVTEAKRSTPSTRNSTWIGLVDSNRTRDPSFLEINDSSEISEEHVLIDLRPEEGWGERRNISRTGQHGQDDSGGPNNNNTLGLLDPESHEDHGNVVSDTPRPFITLSTPQPQTSNSILSEFVKTLMRPFEYWTRSKGAGKTEGELTVPEGKNKENQRQEQTSSKNLSFLKPGGIKGSMDNAILEHRSGTFSLRGATSELQSSEKELSEQEKELIPLIKLTPAVQNTEQSKTSTHPGAVNTFSDNPQATLNSKLFVIFYVSGLFRSEPLSRNSTKVFLFLIYWNSNKTETKEKAWYI